MIPDQVTLSRRAAIVVGYLEPGTAREFREVVAEHGSIDSVPLPFRLWLRDPREIPVYRRASQLDAATGERVTRPIPSNPFD